MIKIYPHLFIGNALDYEDGIAHMEGWSVVHACKEPYHRQFVGYETRSAPQDDPEYLWAVRGNRLALNLIDGENPAFVPKEAIDYALEFTNNKLSLGKNVLIHCNQGLSRGPSIGFLYLAKYTEELSERFMSALGAFTLMYPSYNPGQGIYEFVKMRWPEYARKP